MSSTASGSTASFTPTQSDYQRIDVFETPEFGRVLTLDGNVMLTERDEFIYRRDDYPCADVGTPKTPRTFLLSAQATAV